MANKVALKLVKGGLEGIVERWVKLKREIDTRKREVEKLEPPIRESLEHAPDRERKFGPHVLFLTEDSTRINFDRKLALQELGEDTLGPYLSETSVRGSIRLK